MEDKGRSLRRKYLEPLLDISVRHLISEIDLMPRRRAAALLRAIDSVSGTNCGWQTYELAWLIRSRVAVRAAAAIGKEGRGMENINPLSLSACACLGPQGGDPFCPCEMSRRGLKATNIWTPEKVAEFDAALRKAIKEKKL
jgi:hypothetical protein